MSPETEPILPKVILQKRYLNVRRKVAMILWLLKEL